MGIHNWGRNKKDMNIEEDNFKDAMTELTEELTKLSGGINLLFLLWNLGK